jgi:hypothetical protein
MRIKGIYADESERFHPEQWVNVYELDVCGRTVFYCSCQVKDLDLDDEEEYGLEPTDADGNVISVKTALAHERVEIK